LASLSLAAFFSSESLILETSANLSHSETGMNAFGFRADQKITEVIGQGSFTYSAEVIPPRNGTEQRKVLEQIHALTQAGAHFLSVTKGAGGSLRGGSLPISQLVKENFQVPCIAHFTCRDITAEEVENQLMDHHYFGIRNILALRGDPPMGRPDWTPRDGAYPFAYQLIEQIQKLNDGQYLSRSNGPKADDQVKTDFCIGAAAYPEHPDEKERLDFFRLKTQAGACYGITQMIFDPEVYARFLDLCEKNQIDIPILAGTRILKNKEQAKRMEERFQCSISQDLFNALPNDKAQEDHHQIQEIFHDYVEKLKSYGAPGIHLFVLSDTESACQFFKRGLSTVHSS
jgi:methylenetetrahydrofolate reductase (NADPH)